MFGSGHDSPSTGSPRLATTARVAGAYAAFHLRRSRLGLARNGVLHGFPDRPPKEPPARQSCRGWRHFGHGVQACIDHELAILATGVAVVWASWGAPNQVGMWTFLALWGMRLSAKLNVFLGVLNLGEAFLPAHLWPTSSASCPAAA